MKFILGIIEIILIAVILANINVAIYSIKWCLIILSLIALMAIAFTDGLFRR